MTIRHIIYRILSTVVIAMTAILLPSCSEERFAIPDYTVSGEDVRLTVPILIPDMPESTRGDLSPNQLNRVESLWIRTYNAETLEATCDWLKLTPNTTDLNNMREVELTTKSGHSYIVAVANVDRLGISGNTPNGELKPLQELLEVADTWDKFLQIAVISPSDEDDVNAPQSNTLPMCGCYSDTYEQYYLWQTANFQPYFIPASKDKVEFTGGIRLRRLVSHIKFNFTAADDIELTVNSYQVMNAPKFSWLYERNAEVSTMPTFGDQASSAEDALRYYADVPQFGSQFIKEKTEDGKKVQTFDFWQAENKHTGTCTSYADRGLKTITTDGVTLFTSLTGETWTPNNEASYVIVDCDIEYNNKIKVDGNGAIVTDDGTEVERSGHATYFIHLGNILGGDKKTEDFNCFRNVDYTYNVTVNGLDDIRVDAFAEIEKYHNEEGLVVDLNANAFSLDGHYAVFNIQLTETELNENFGFIITTYDNGRQITLSEKNPRDDINSSIVIYEDEAKTKRIDPKYYNWIELRPTTGENVLAEYKPRYGTNSDGKTFLLSSLFNVDGKLSLPQTARSESGWYTVFVNEYTYEPMYTGTEGYANETTAEGQRPNWMNYVNQNPRRFYIKVSYQESPDGNSVYARSKYAVQQQSLMTYYSQQNLTPDRTAIGVERENETLGMNIRHVFWGGNSTSNGRWNTAQFLDDVNNSTLTENPSINWNADRANLKWSKYLSLSEPLKFPAVEEGRLQGGPAIAGGTKSLPKVAKANATGSVFTDPQSSDDYNIDDASACLARNRDNNGNGRIDPDELRWYLPAIDNYIDMSLGAKAMPQPLMEYQGITFPKVVDKSNFSTTQGEINSNFYSRYMFIASNVAPKDVATNVLWAMEGTSVSRYADIEGWAGAPIYPWQIRCIRNLGANLTSVTKDNKVTIPFLHRPASRTITMNYFNLASIRTTQYSGNGKGNLNLMPVHTINSSYNSVYAAFEYADRDFVIPEAGTVSWQEHQDHYFDKLVNYINSNPCGSIGLSGEGWRVPNQIELTMMMNTGVLSGGGIWISSTVDYFNQKNGVGSDNVGSKFFMGAQSSRTILLRWDNYSSYTPRMLRCVRDVQP